jgi:prepilin-type N-terminal cleavage/methylation domain-containing protein
MTRSGFTLPEVLVATLVLAIGILGLASSGTFIAIQASDARAITEGSLVAGRVLDSLRSIPCPAVTAGQATNRLVTVRWTAVAAPRSVHVHTTLELTARQRVRQWPLEALLSC